MVSHKKGKKKSKKSQISSLFGSGSEGTVHAEIVDEDSEYPTSRVIKRAPNGDVVVESLPEQTGASHLPEEPTNDSMIADSQWPMKLDSHWDSLSLDERRSILRISKEELFNMIKSYKNVHSCDCSMCGRHNNITMEQEMEEIYNELYETAKEEDSDTDFFLFHLKLIKEYQSGNNRAHPKHHTSADHTFEEEEEEYDSTSCLSKNAARQLPVAKNVEGALQTSQSDFLHSLDDSSVKFCLAEKNRSDYIDKGIDNHHDSNNLLEESLNSHDGKTTSSSLKHEIEQFKHNKQKEVSEHVQNHLDSNINKPALSDGQLSTSEDDAKLVQFARTFVSSHPRIAEEFINKALMYPHIRALTEDVMRNKGESLRKAMESLVLQQQDESTLNEETIEHSNKNATSTVTVTSSAQLDANSQLPEVLKTLGDTKNISLAGSSRLSSLISGVGFDFSNVNNADNFKNLFDEIIDDENRLKDFSGKSEYMELERIRDEISAGEDVEDSYEWSDAEFEDGYDDSNNEDGIIDNANFEDAIENTLLDYHGKDSSFREACIGEDVGEDDARFLENGVDMHPQNPRHHHNHNHESHHRHRTGESDVENEEYNSDIDHAERLEEGRRLIQIAITKLLQKKLIASFKEKEAERNRLKLLMELEAEENQKKEKEKKKQKKKEKEKEKKRLQQLAKEEEKKKQQEEEVRLQKEAEEKELARREAQRKKVEEARKKKDEERKRKLEEQRLREEEQARQRKLKEDQRRQKEEEQRLKREEQEKKKLLLEDEKKTQLLKSKENGAKEKEIERKIKSVPYGYSSLEDVPHKSSISDDIFKMINQASKSLSSSPSHNNENVAVPPLILPTHDSLNISTNSLYSHLTPLNAPDVSPQTQPAAPTYAQGIIQTPLAWDERQTSQNLMFNGNQLNDSRSILNSQEYQTFEASSIRIADEMNNITSFLNDTTLNDVHLPTEADHHISSVDHLKTTSRANSVTYDQPSLWPNDSHQTPHTHYAAQPPVSNPLMSQSRRSIWDSGADLPFTVGTTHSNDYNSRIWSNAPSTVSSGLASGNMENDVESKIDILSKSYTLLAPDHSFVPLDKLYQTSLTFISAKTGLTYSDFVSTLLTMKASHNCELLNDNSGLLAYCRMGMSTSKQSNISSYSTLPYSRTQHSPVQPVQILNSEPNTLYTDAYSQPTPSNHMLHVPGASPHLSSEQTVYMNMGQAFPQKFQTSNIWD